MGNLKKFEAFSMQTDSEVKTIDELESSLISKYKGLQLSIYNKRDKIYLSRIEIFKEYRNIGIGNKIMNDIIDFADKNSKIITLTPSTDFGATSVSRLKSFYKRFGFIENTGKNKDYSISESMYRLPNKK